ncbi:MAG TPA: hypothetical protein VF631_12670 [Allosphingosinicella sp.]|jgi:hypothetical protein|uniref:hypothetical protein n=1 Tax=Allosphingosinicella sp. TaxID=2823234 RepID=UPI002F275536
MPALVKFFVGLAAVILMAWISHGPLGGGARLIDRLEGEARAAVAKAALPGIDVRLSRDPLARDATLSGPANEFQREGQGSLPGLNDLVAGVEGISNVRWATPPPSPGNQARLMPLLLETILLVIPPYLAGLLLAWLFFGRRQRESYL